MVRFSETKEGYKKLTLSLKGVSITMGNEANDTSFEWNLLKCSLYFGKGQNSRQWKFKK
jgi:hypothetical protein